jgi:hypothetical protein
MSIYDFSYIDVDNLEVQVSLVIKDTLDRRTSVLVNPNLDTSTEFEGCRFSQKYKDLCTLMILLHFSDAFGDLREYVGIEVQEYLERRLLFPIKRLFISEGDRYSSYTWILKIQPYSSNFRSASYEGTNSSST